MTTVTVNIPDKDKRALSSFVKERGGEIVDAKKNVKIADASENEEEEVTHGEFFGGKYKKSNKYP